MGRNRRHFWLNRLTLKDGDPIHTDRPFLKPFVIVAADDVWGYRYVAASDKKAALFVRSISSLDFDRIEQGIERRLKTLVGMPVRDRRTWCLDDFRTWLPKRRVKPCREHNHHYAPRCVWCMPTRGMELVDQGPVRLWNDGPLCDPNLLRKYLPRHLGYGPVSVGVCGVRDKRIEPMVVFEGQMPDGEEWRMMICPVNPGKWVDGKWEKEQPICPTYYPGCGTLWHLRNGPKRGMLRDWFEERGEKLCDYEGLPF